MGGTFHGMGLIRLYTTACPEQCTGCYRNWEGSWKDSLRNFTLAQDGCHVTRKYMMFILSWIEVVENYTACGNRLVGETEVLGTNIKHPDGPVVLAEDGHSARVLMCLSNAGCPGLVWTRRTPDPPKPALPTCLPLGGHPIDFADGLKPPCCDKRAILAPSGDLKPMSYGYPASPWVCATCISANMACNGRGSDCCDGLTCVYGFCVKQGSD